MKAKKNITQVIELDGSLYRLDGQALVAIDDLRSLEGDQWLVTDFQEAMSRCMTVEGPVKYAELLVRRKLQELGEFEEPVKIITHWKQKRGKHTTDIYFTAVPSRLARFYFEELGARSHITLVFSMYGILWDLIQRTRSKEPVAVVLRHDRFAEILIGSRDRVYFANRCVAFDTQEEQLHALWETIRSDIQAVENENRFQIHQIICLNWIDALETSSWEAEWQERLIFLEPAEFIVEERPCTVSWPTVIRTQPARRSVSPISAKALYFAKQWAPVFNWGLLAVLVLMLAGWGLCQQQSRQLQQGQAQIRQQINRIHMATRSEPVVARFSETLQFIQKLDLKHRQPSYQQIINDLTRSAFDALRLQLLKVDYTSQQVHLELFGDIQAPFDKAHRRYQGFLQQLKRQGYHIAESRFETQISRSKVVLKLNRPVI